MFFVMNADVCGDFPLCDMVDFYKDKCPKASGIILGTEVCVESTLDFLSCYDSFIMVLGL